MTEMQSEASEENTPASPTQPEPSGKKIRNPLLIAMWAPAYLSIFAVCASTDMLWAALFFMFTLGLLAAYVTEFNVFDELYYNEVMHKTAISSLFGILLGFMAFLASRAMVDKAVQDSSPMSPASKIGLTWIIMSIPAYFLMAFMIRKLNKRDLEEENRIRKEKRAKRKKGGPPIMDKDGF